jgi:hypothetical protein
MKNTRNKLMMLLALWFFSSTAFANPNIFKGTTDASVDAIYAKVHSALENEKLFVVFEPNIGKNLKGFANKWGDNYNRQQLQSIRSLVFCSAWYANEVSNLDPDMLGLCPMRVTLVQKVGKTTALFVLPSKIAVGSPAFKTLQELETTVIKALLGVGFTRSK